MGNLFFKALGIETSNDLRKFSKESGVNTRKLKYYNEQNIFPHKGDLMKILQVSGLTELELKLKMGILDYAVKEFLASNSSEISKLASKETINEYNVPSFEPVFQTDKGRLYQADCIQLIKTLPRDSVDLIFADPPFNLSKDYESGINDNLSKVEYLRWTEEWVLGCIDLLKEGGSFFVWNLPVWNTYISDILNRHLSFRHWISVDIKYSLPIQNRLYPSHYALLYYTKGEKPKAFNQERRPLEICRHCGGDIRDYGGYKDKLNTSGINLSDVWYDIPPVRHSKYKTRASNELSLKLLERVISLGSNEGDVVFDPFGGSGTTYIVSEILNRQWIGCEIGPVDTIIERFKDYDFHKKIIEKIQKDKNVLFTEEARKLRLKNNHWLPETLNKSKKSKKESNIDQLDLFAKNQ